MFALVPNPKPLLRRKFPRLRNSSPGSNSSNNQSSPSAEMASNCSRFISRATSNKISSLKSFIKTSTASTTTSSSPRIPLPTRSTSTTSSPLRRRFSVSRTPSELGCVQSMLPLHSAVAAARMTSCLGSLSGFRALTHGT